ncbi:MAG: D-glycerate dehydrogenase [Candidatus Eremiobacteraeota bacterium]|nr:D-glycerate dehydrogenase [Candidatus Eremiobacteraeota bacterium]
MTGTFRALLDWDCPPELLEPLVRMGVSVERAPGEHSEAALCEAISQTHALICAPWTPVTRAVVAAADALRVVSTVAVGYDNLDVAALRERGIRVGHTPGVVVEATADLTYGLILAVMRRIIAGDRYVRSDRWPSGLDALGHDLHGKTLGIIGLGAIGSSVARRALASGMKIAYTNRRPKSDAPPQAAFMALDDLLAKADCVCVLAPLSESTRGMIDAPALAKMKRGSYLVNAARGGLVDETALYGALASGHLAGAAADVMEPEPIGGDHPLLSLPNFFITPHIGTATYETRAAMGQLCIANAVAGLRGEALPAEVPA